MEVAETDDGVAIRQSVVPDVAINLPAQAWRAFLATLKNGEFDRPESQVS